MNEKYIKASPKGKALPIYAITVGINHTQEKIFRPNGSIFHHIMFVQEGEGVFELNNEKHVLKAGTAMFFSKNMPINYYASGSLFKTAWITFDGISTESIFEYFSAKGFSFIENSSLISKILAFVKHVENGESFEGLSKAVYDIVITYFSELNKATCPVVLSNAKNYIATNFKNDISIAEIAAYVGISQSLLFRLFKANEKCTPIEYLKRTRIESAKLLLSNEQNMNIKDVGSSCGFSDTSYFVKVFRDETGVTPKNFRKLYGI
ncbi:MAG: AraC family transcriptional regulator [Ruminococcaceae bacterium]|nr:AraC family transcriptional regulator [Oscillospiraceae bacterium]